MEIEVFKTTTSKICKRDDGIIFQKLLPDAIETLETAKEVSDIIEKLSGGEKCLFLADASNIKYMERDARVYYSSSEQSKRLYRGVAVISNTSIGKIIGNFFLGFNKPPFPFKMFTSGDEAVVWLKELQD